MCAILALRDYHAGVLVLLNTEPPNLVFQVNLPIHVKMERMQAHTLTLQMGGGGSFHQNVELYLFTGEYSQIQSCTHRFFHKKLVTPSAVCQTQ